MADFLDVNVIIIRHERLPFFQRLCVNLNVVELFEIVDHGGLSAADVALDGHHKVVFAFTVLHFAKV